jgi:hypothetical protein
MLINQNVIYQNDDDAVPSSNPKAKRGVDESASDEDFAEASDSDGDKDSEPGDPLDPRELETGKDRSSKGTKKSVQQRSTPKKPVSQIKGQRMFPSKTITLNPNAKSIKQGTISGPPVNKQSGSINASTVKKGVNTSSVSISNSSIKLSGTGKAQIPDGQRSTGIKRPNAPKQPASVKVAPAKPAKAATISITEQVSLMKDPPKGAQNLQNSANIPTAISMSPKQGHAAPMVPASGQKQALMLRDSDQSKASDLQTPPISPTSNQDSIQHSSIMAKQKHVKHSHADSFTTQTTKPSPSPLMPTSSTDTRPRPDLSPTQAVGKVSPKQANLTLSSTLKGNTLSEKTAKTGSNQNPPPITQRIQIKLKTPFSLPMSKARSPDQPSSMISPSTQNGHPRQANASPAVASKSQDQPSPLKTRKADHLLLSAISQASTAPQMDTDLDLEHSRPTKMRKITSDQTV